jgi:hypothetical protein
MEREVYKFPDEKQAEDDAKDSISFEIDCYDTLTLVEN